jgi:hypothetical protein
MDCIKIHQYYDKTCKDDFEKPKDNLDTIEHLVRPLHCVEIIKDYISCTNKHANIVDKEDT